jgi:hypothetical protein
MKYISIPVFIFCFAIGILYVYLTAPEPRVVIVYPTPDNKDMFQYKDSVLNCFNFNHEEVDCPDNNDVKEITIQE